MHVKLLSALLSVDKNVLFLHILEPFTSDNFEVEHHVVDPKPFVLGCSTNPYIIYQLARKSVFGQKHCHAYALTLGEWFIPKIN